MHNFFKTTLTCLALALLVTGCNEGPAEKKGKQLDQQVEHVKDKLQNKGPAQKAGERLDDVTDSN